MAVMWESKDKPYAAVRPKFYHQKQTNVYISLSLSIVYVFIY